MKNLAYYPINLFVESATTMLGRGLCYFASVYSSIWLGLSIAAQEIIPLYFILQGMIFVVVLALRDGFAVFQILSLLIFFAVFLRFPISYRYLLPVFVFGFIFGYRLVGLYG